MSTGMKPSELVKKCGLKNMKHLEEVSGVDYQTLLNYYKGRRKLFRLLCLGAKADILLKELKVLDDLE